MSDGKSNMPLKTRLLIHLRSEREKISYLSRREKLSYILEYYWIWIVGIIAAVSFLIFFTYRMFFVSKDYWFYAIYANTTADAGERSALWYDFADYEGFDLKEKSMVMNAASYFDPSVRGGTVNSYFQSFVAVTEGGDLDVLTMGKEGITKIGESGRLADLNQPEYQKFREKYGDRFVYCIPYDEEYSTEPVPVAIDVSDSLLVTKYHLYEGDCCLGIGAYTKRPETVEHFLEFIFAEDKGTESEGSTEAVNA